MERENGVRARFLQNCKDKRMEVTIFMRNGFQMRGFVTEFDGDAITANVDGVEKLLSQAAVSTIEPSRNYAPRQHYVNAPWGTSTGRSSERRFLDT